MSSKSLGTRPTLLAFSLWDAGLIASVSEKLEIGCIDDDDGLAVS